MKKCLHCSYEFSYSELLKANFRFNSGRVECPKCHKTNYIATTSNLWFFLLAVVPFELVYVIFQFLDIKSWTVIPCVISALLAFIFISPYITKFKKQPDGLLEDQFREMEERKRSGKGSI